MMNTTIITQRFKSIAHYLVLVMFIAFAYHQIYVWHLKATFVAPSI